MSHGSDPGVSRQLRGRRLDRGERDADCLTVVAEVECWKPPRYSWQLIGGRVTDDAAPEHHYADEASRLLINCRRLAIVAGRAPAGEPAPR